MEEALDVCGFTEEEITEPNKKSEGEIVKEFLAWASEAQEHTLVGQNVSFDRDFLKAASERSHLDWPLAYRTIDTHTLCYMHMIKAGILVPTVNRLSALNLDAVLNYVGIPDEHAPHNALTGPLSHAEVPHRHLHDKNLLPASK